MEEIFKCLSSKIRRDILMLLRSGELSASAIAENFELSKPTISHHLNQLKAANLIDVRREQNTLYYSLKTSVIEDLYIYFLNLKEDKWKNT